MPRTDDHIWGSFIVSAVSRTTGHARNLQVWSLDKTERTRQKEKKYRNNFTDSDHTKLPIDLPQTSWKIIAKHSLSQLLTRGFAEWANSEHP